MPYYVLLLSTSEIMVIHNMIFSPWVCFSPFYVVHFVHKIKKTIILNIFENQI